MITINLLKGPPTLDRPARRRAQSELVAGGVVVACTVAVWGWLVFDGNDAGQRLEQKVREKQSRLAVMEKTRDQVLALKAQRRTIAAEQKRLTTLTRDPNGPLRLLSVIGQVVDPLDVWLLRLQTNDQRVLLSGLALSQDAVVKLTENLEETKVIGSINTFETQADTVQPSRLRFSINADAVDHG